MTALINENRKIGIGLTGFGALFLTMGVVLLFDTKLLILGNILFMSGIVLLIGTRRTVSFLLHKRRGAACFLVGAALVTLSWPVVGMLVEIFGILNLFGNFFPIAVAFLRQVPVIGAFLSLPVVSRLVDRLSGELLPTHSS